MCILKSLAQEPKNVVNDILSLIYMSDDESNVMSMCLRNKSNQQIASKLSISERSVYRYKTSLRKKIEKAYCIYRTNVLSFDVTGGDTMNTRQALFDFIGNIPEEKISYVYSLLTNLIPLSTTQQVTSQIVVGNPSACDSMQEA